MFPFPVAGRLGEGRLLDQWPPSVQRSWLQVTAERTALPPKSPVLLVDVQLKRVNTNNNY